MTFLGWHYRRREAVWKRGSDVHHPWRQTCHQKPKRQGGKARYPPVLSHLKTDCRTLKWMTSWRIRS